MLRFVAFLTFCLREYFLFTHVKIKFCAYILRLHSLHNSSLCFFFFFFGGTSLHICIVNSVSYYRSKLQRVVTAKFLLQFHLDRKLCTAIEILTSTRFKCIKIYTYMCLKKYRRMEILGFRIVLRNNKVNMSVWYLSWRVYLSVKKLASAWQISFIGYIISSAQFEVYNLL